ncbi:DUF167 domain-containing protein [Candidatus Nomurabacteria bacterium]|nr:DUF167 domain-containing protein [Candidatus Nomurabacteria bacterium]
MYIKVKVDAGAGKEIFKKISEDHFEISVKEKAEQNMGNKRVLELVREYFAGKAKSIKIVNGHHSSSKILSVDY